MNDFLPYVVGIMLLIVVLGFFNERKTKLTYEIALMLFSICIGAVFLVAYYVIDDHDTSILISDIITFDLEDYLMKGVLCYMLFAGSCHMQLRDFSKQKRQIGVLAILATLLGAILYGGAFYLISKLIGLGFSLPVCLMFGSIVSPTDPIAATSILKKFGLPEDISFLMESESLLNDGVGVALFVCFSGMVTASGGAGFFAVFFRELFGAVLVGIVVTALCFYIFYKTADVTRQIFVSILAVSAAYLLCEKFEFSGAIASVVCGVLFSALRKHFEENGKEWHLEQFDVFWNIADNLLNSILYVILGLSFLRIIRTPYIVLVSVGAIVCNLIGRSASVGLSTFIMGSIPSGYDRKNFIKLMTWGGLRGALSIALAMSTKPMLPDETYKVILGGTYAIVAFTTIIQGLTMTKVYNSIKASVKSM
ncbi:MAG: sodium:proton antiporter [Lachnospiraceae bacterium]|nr:sodium:proton antiporter [Lachnospiraceae bacterium]